MQGATIKTIIIFNVTQYLKENGRGGITKFYDTEGTTDATGP
jgi:hypothetical protein